MLAAARAGIKKVMMPDKNEKDLIEIGDDVDLDIEFTFVSRLEDVLANALGDDILDGKPKGPAVGAAPKKKKSTRKKASNGKTSSSRPSA